MDGLKYYEGANTPEAIANHKAQRAAILKRLSFTPQAFLDNQCEMHFGIGIPEDLPRWSGR